jgi:Lon protease-like protein
MASQWDGPIRLPGDFAGIVRLFPLPNLVLFPHVVQPLHIFEPRYCEMLQESLDSDRLITMALLRPGWEKSPFGQPSISDFVCVGQILSHAPTEEGRHNIMLIGLARARIVEELESERSFRTARVELVDDVYPAEGAVQRMKLQQSLLDVFRKFIPEGTLAQESFQQMLNSQMSLGMLTDLIGFSMSIPVPIKEQLLGMASVDARAKLLVQCLRQMAETRQSEQQNSESSWGFPPKFSLN